MTQGQDGCQHQRSSVEKITVLLGGGGKTHAGATCRDCGYIITFCNQGYRHNKKEVQGAANCTKCKHHQLEENTK